MKIFKLLSISIISIIILMIIIGYTMPDVEYNNSVEVNKSVEQAWAVFDNEENMAKWMEGFKSIEMISGEINQPGSKFKLTMQENGRDVSITEEVVRYNKNQEYTFKFYNDDVKGTASIIFTPNENGTNITAKHTIAGKGLFLKAIMPFFKGMMQIQGQANYDRLKELIDNN